MDLTASFEENNFARKSCESLSTLLYLQKTFAFEAFYGGSWSLVCGFQV